MEAVSIPRGVRRVTPRFAITSLGRGWLAPVLLACFGASLRFYHLGWRSLWLDEVLAANSVRLSTLGQVIDWTHGTLDQMPLLNVLLWSMRGLGGQEWVVRLPAALAGAGTVFILYVLGRRLWGPRVGFLAALLMAVMPFAVWWGQQARPYSLLMLFTAAQMSLAYQAVTRSHVLDWAGLSLASILNSYTHFVALAAMAAVFVFVGLVLALDGVAIVRRLRRASRPQVQRTSRKKSLERIDRPSFRPMVRNLGLAAAAAGCTVLAYIPWLPWLRAFLARPDLSTGHTTSSSAITLDDVQAYLADFGLHGALLILLVLGLVAALLALRAERWRSGALVLCWLCIPVLAFWWHVRGGLIGLDPRDLSFLFPGAVLAIAIGVETLSTYAATLWNRSGREGQLIVSAGAFVTVTLLLLQTVLPALAQSYTNPEDDYRGLANVIVAGGGSDSTVLAMGGCSGFITTALPYYLWLRHSPVQVLDASQLDDQAVGRLRHERGPVWAAAFGACPTGNFLNLPRPGLHSRLFVGLALFRLDKDAPPLDEAVHLLQWASVDQPELAASAKLLTALSGRAPLGHNVLPPPGAQGWSLTPGAHLLDATGVLQLSPAGPMVNVMAGIGSAPGRTYVISFRYRNGSLNGGQHVFVSAHDKNGAWLAVYPSGGGYFCAPTSKWAGRSFAFTTPPNTSSLTVWLRADGTGSAEFTSVALRPVGS